MNTMFRLSIVALSCLLLACSSVDKKSLKEENLLPPAKGWNSSEASTATPPRATKRLPLPMNVAVHLSEPSDSRFEWSARERGKMAMWGRSLKKERIVKEFFLMSKLVSTGNSLSDSRSAARLHGADVVLVVKSSGELAESWNPLALFYLTLVGYYIFPGSSAEAVVVANAVVLDVESGVPLFSLDSEGKKSSIAPGGWIDSDELIVKALSKARGALGREFVAGMQDLAKKLRSTPRPVRKPKVRRLAPKRRVPAKSNPTPTAPILREPMQQSTPKPKLPRIIYR